MFHTALSVMEHSGCPSGNVWWPQDRTVTISLIPPAGNRLVRHTPHRGSAHNYHLSVGQGPAECGLIAVTVGSLSQCSVRNKLMAVEVKASERHEGRLQPGEMKKDIHRLEALRVEARNKGTETLPVVIAIDTAPAAYERMTLETRRKSEV